jgi:hypothetical protein
LYWYSGAARQSVIDSPAFVGVLQQLWRKAGLRLNDEVALDQARQELIHRAVAQAPIERAIARIANRIAGAGFELIVQ